MFQLEWFDENDPRPFNINNLAPKPNDYAQVHSMFGLNHWITIHPLNPHEYKLTEKDFKTLLEKSTLRMITRKKFTDDDMDDFSSSFIKWINNTCNLYPDGVFIKMTHKSTKKSFEGEQKPLRNAFEVLSRLTSTNDIFQHDTDFNQSIYISKWVNIDRNREYRVFYIDCRLVAISQQDCYRSITFSDREELVLSDAEKISKYKFDLYPTATLDIAIVDEKVFLIECNPPSLHYGAGSSLFYEDDFKTFNHEIIRVKIR